MSAAAADVPREVLLCTALRFVCVRREQDELMRQQEASVSDEERRGVQREQERLLVKMEHKGEQISKLYTHITQVGFLKICSSVYTHALNESLILWRLHF